MTVAWPKVTLAPRCRLVPMILSGVPPAVDPMLTENAVTVGIGSDGSVAAGRVEGAEGSDDAFGPPHPTKLKATANPMLNLIPMTTTTAFRSFREFQDESYANLMR